MGSVSHFLDVITYPLQCVSSTPPPHLTTKEKICGIFAFAVFSVLTIGIFTAYALYNRVIRKPVDENATDITSKVATTILSSNKLQDVQPKEVQPEEVQPEEAQPEEVQSEEFQLEEVQSGLESCSLQVRVTQYIIKEELKKLNRAEGNVGVGCTFYAIEGAKYFNQNMDYIKEAFQEKRQDHFEHLYRYIIGEGIDVRKRAIDDRLLKEEQEGINPGDLKDFYKEDWEYLASEVCIINRDSQDIEKRKEFCNDAFEKLFTHLFDPKNIVGTYPTAFVVLDGQTFSLIKPDEKHVFIFDTHLSELKLVDKQGLERNLQERCQIFQKDKKFNNKYMYTETLDVDIFLVQFQPSPQKEKVNEKKKT
jgi:hypothetical protein